MLQLWSIRSFLKKMNVLNLNVLKYVWRISYVGSSIKTNSSQCGFQGLQKYMRNNGSYNNNNRNEKNLSPNQNRMNSSSTPPRKYNNNINNKKIRIIIIKLIISLY